MHTIRIKNITKIIVLTIFILFIGLLFFLYKYFYQTMVQAKVVVILTPQTAPYSLNTKLWNDVIDNLEYKKSDLVKSEHLKDNPFLDASQRQPDSILISE